jgi:hypothetical protein
MQFCGDCQPRLLLTNLLSNYQTGSAVNVCKACKDLLLQYFPSSFLLPQGGDGNSFLFVAPFQHTTVVSGSYKPSSVPGVFLLNQQTPLLNLTGGTYQPSSRVPQPSVAIGPVVQRASNRIWDHFNCLWQSPCASSSGRSCVCASCKAFYSAIDRFDQSTTAELLEAYQSSLQRSLPSPFLSYSAEHLAQRPNINSRGPEDSDIEFQPSPKRRRES